MPLKDGFIRAKSLNKPCVVKTCLTDSCLEEGGILTYILMLFSYVGEIFLITKKMLCTFHCHSWSLLCHDGFCSSGFGRSQNRHRNGSHSRTSQKHCHQVLVECVGVVLLEAKCLCVYLFFIFLYF